MESKMNESPPKESSVYSKNNSQITVSAPSSCWMLNTVNIKSTYDYIQKEDLHVLVISKPFDALWQEVFLKVLLYFQNHGIKTSSNKFSIQTAKEEDMISQFVDQDIAKLVNLDLVGEYTDEDDSVNRIVTLGGDGTILFAIKMFYNK